MVIGSLDIWCIAISEQETQLVQFGLITMSWRVDFLCTYEKFYHIQFYTTLIYLMNTHIEEIYWKQKSMIHWLATGDSNTKYCHDMTRTRIASTRISFIKDYRANLIESEN